MVLRSSPSRHLTPNSLRAYAQQAGGVRWGEGIGIKPILSFSCERLRVFAQTQWGAQAGNRLRAGQLNLRARLAAAFAAIRCCCQHFHPDQPQEKIHPDLSRLRHGFHFIGHRHNPEAAFRHSSAIHGHGCWRIKQRQASPAATAARWRGI